MTFYIAELENKNSYRQAEAVEAKNLSAAKIRATKGQCFQGTVLEIGTEVNSDGFILNPVAQKINGKWY